MVKKKKYDLYDICTCNHECLQHKDNLTKCAAHVPIGHESHRGGVNPETPYKSCSCLKFKLNRFAVPKVCNCEK